MKTVLIPIALLLCIHINAQIPDSLGVDLPWETVNVSDCENTMGEGPQTDNDHIFIDLKSDVIVLDDQGGCSVRIKDWIIFDWQSGSLYDFKQIAKIKDFANTNCETDLYFHYDEFPLTLTPADLLIDLDASHEYSFSFSDSNEGTVLLDGNSDQNLELYVYDFTDNTVCKTNVYLTQCEEDIDLLFPESAEIEFNQEPYIEVTLEMLGVVINYPCDSYITKIRIGQTTSNILFSQNVGKIVPANVEIEFSDGTVYKKKVNVNVTGIKPDPLSMFIEEKSFVAGETISLEIWSEPVDGLTAWQLQLLFKDTEILGIETSELFTEIPINIMEEESALRALWFPSDGFSIDVTSDATWFTINLKPEIDGTTLDIFETEQDPWSLIGIEDENYIYEFEAEFVFNVAPRNILGIEDDYDFQSVHVFPNPTVDKIVIDGFSNTSNVTKIEVIDLAGKLIKNKMIENPTSILELDIAELPKGMYILKAKNGTAITTQKITKI